MCLEYFCPSGIIVYYFFFFVFFCFFFLLMIRRPPRSTLDRSSAASDVYKRQVFSLSDNWLDILKVPRELRTVVENGFDETSWKLIRKNQPVDRFVISSVGTLYDQPVSVSYTHLRAHETVLDLVCRLLLEKKKPELHTI